MSEKGKNNIGLATNKDEEKGWFDKNGKEFTSITLFIIVNLLFAWFYNAYLYEKILSIDTWWTKVFYLKLFTFSENYSFIFNSLFLIGIAVFLFIKRCSILDYSKKFFKSFKYFGALLQHYSIGFLLIFIITPIFSPPYYQEVFCFKGDFVIFIILIYLGILVLGYLKRYKCEKEIISIIPNEGDPITSFDEDLLEFDSIVSSISTDIISLQNKSRSRVLGLSGDWGSGKTSLFNLLLAHFNNELGKNNTLFGYKRIRVIKINVHKYEKNNKLYLHFFDELLTKLQEEIFLPRLDSVLITKTLLFPFVKEINLDSLFNKVIPLSRIDRYLKKYSKWLQKMDLTVLCLIDDVDRLQKKKDIDSVFKLINLVKQNMSNIVLFVNFDSNILSRFYQDSEKDVKT